MRNFEIEQLVYKIGLQNLEHKHDKFNFRCSICGDSAYSQRKRRGWILHHNDNYIYHCFNCGYSNSLQNYLKEFHYELYKEYVSIILFSDKNTKESKVKQNTKIINYEKLELDSVFSLPDEHIAKIYIKGRKIPLKYWDNIYYTSAFKKYVNTLIENKFTDTNYDDARIVIPIYNIHKKIVGVQGRSLEKNAKIRYMTILFNDNELNSCGLERIDRTKTIFVTEGFFDSLFIPNAITMNSSNIPLNKLLEISNKENFVFIFDNEKRNKQIINKMIKIVKNGFKIVIWPNNIKGKDINEMIENISKDELLNIINNNIYSGTVAEIKIRTRFI